MIPYVAPEFEKKAFNCPYCNVYAPQRWEYLSYSDIRMRTLHTLRIAICFNCDEFSIWYQGKLMHPDNSGIPSPNQDLDSPIKDDYIEAQYIVNKSPRGAAALLRLAIQKLCIQLGEKGKDINNDIANLVQKGLSPTIQQSLDIVRVIGNESVHPGELDLKDDRETAIKLFSLINLIAETMITQPKEIKKMYDSLPESKKIAIENRDRKGN
jgi:hypothetical protein